MREIKFRAWNGKEMFNVFGMKWDTQHNFICGNDEWNNPASYAPAEKVSNILMQYTGIKDKNNVEIYEGDIVKIYDEVVEVKAPEIFECDAFVVYGYNFCSNFFIENYSRVGMDSFYEGAPEVIGNIYQN